MSGATRYIAVRALTGEVTSWDLPLTNVEWGPELSGAGSLRATLEPKLVSTHADLLEEGNTYLYVEQAGLLRWGGIVWSAEPEGGSYPIEAATWSSYLKRRHDVHGELNARGPYVYADPCGIIRDTWAYAQEAPDGDIGVRVDDTTSSAKVGTPASPLSIAWWEIPELANVIDQALKGVVGGPEWMDDVEWGPDGKPLHRVRLGWPRLGSRRTDLSFASGVNIVGTPRIAMNADEYAQVIIATGAGEGRSRRRAISAVRDGRLRLEHHLDIPGEKGTDRLSARAEDERAIRQIRGDVDEITVIDHPAAPLGSWRVGDDVQVTVNGPWASWSGWCRIVGWTISDDHPQQARLDLRRADSYTYGG
ncbi:hypothetical protein [Embleya sp. NPDC059237]|uniref:hypothetical protein n=1 Tax=Embleya sp. NPDC059237 TaxID=3346784 RepID=UPI00368995EB